MAKRMVNADTKELTEAIVAHFKETGRSSLGFGQLMKVLKEASLIPDSNHELLRAVADLPEDKFCLSIGDTNVCVIWPRTAISEAICASS